MELQPFLLSNRLPKEIVLHEIYKYLWKNRNVLTDVQKDSIINDHFHLNKIVNKYYNDSSLSRNKRSERYFLLWLENDILSVLNDDRGFIDGISDNLLIECPGVTKGFLLSCDSIDDLPEKIYTLWTMMTPIKKTTMYNRTNHY